MDNKVPTEIDKLNSNLTPQLEFANAADATGLWFAAAVMLAVFAAGVIVYRGGGGNSDIVTASNVPMPAAAHAAHNDQLSPPILPER